ncbi:MAG: metallophosphoesterase [Lachnospiraceae bacterium]|nr:metallophosphoesterase [Lachnospiraceae bacterium]
MIYLTGDTHGDFERYLEFTNKMQPTDNDVMIVLGDAGLNYYGDDRDAARKRFVNSFPFITFCIHGNHEMRPFDIASYKVKEFCCGKVWFEEEFPNILFAKDGEIFEFDGLSCIVIGGAYSVDKHYRLTRGWKWFENEQPSAEIKEYVERRLASRNNKIDIVLSHTCPLKYEPIEVFLSMIDQSTVDNSTERWLDTIEDKIEYSKWYCGHYHTIKKIDKMQFMFEEIDMLMTS